MRPLNLQPTPLLRRRRRHRRRTLLMFTLLPTAATKRKTLLLVRDLEPAVRHVGSEAALLTLCVGEDGEHDQGTRVRGC